MKSTRLLAVMAYLGIIGLGGARAEPAGDRPRARHLSHVRLPRRRPRDARCKPALTAAEAHALWDKKAAAFVDVLPQAPKPAGLAPGGRSGATSRVSTFPAGLWLPDTGYGALAPVTLDYFQRGLKQASDDDLNRPLVFYCARHCWMSWNAAKRAKTLGYTHVFWYQDGTQGWQEAGYSLKEQTAFPRP